MELINNKANWPWVMNERSFIHDKEKEYPKISIVTPSYNQGQYIEETILSVINQNYPNLEYIIIDGGSTDTTIDIIKKYDKHLTFWISEKDSGQSEAINKGINRVTGEIFNWLNSDDYLELGTLHLIAELFRNTSANVVCGKANHFGDGINYISDVSTYFDIKNNAAFVPRINQPATFFKTNVVRELGPLNNRLHYCMDLEWWMKYLVLYKHNHIAFTTELLVNFREHNTSKTVAHSHKFVQDKCLLLTGILSKKRGVKNLFGDYYFPLALDDFSIEFLERMTVKDLLMGVVVFYGRREFDKVKVLLDYLNPKYLSDAELEKLNVVKFRLKYIPKFLYQLRNK